MPEFDKHGRTIEYRAEVPFSEKDSISKAADVARKSGIFYGQFMAQKYEAEQKNRLKSRSGFVSFARTGERKLQAGKNARYAEYFLSLNKAVGSAHQLAQT